MNMYKTILIILFSVFSLNIVHAQSSDISHSYSAVSSYQLVDLKKQKNAVINIDNKLLSLFVFLSPECPLCQNYTKTLNQLQEKFKQQVNLYGIIPGHAYTVKEVSDFKLKYKIGYRLFIDTKQKLTNYLQAAVTPQVVLINNKGSLIYTGAIDDWVQSLGKKRLQVSQHYAEDAIKQSLQPEIVKIKKTNAIGCKINDY